MGTAFPSSDLLSKVANELDSGAALGYIVQQALIGTQSRHALVAVLNQSMGKLEIRYGVGVDSDDREVDEFCPVDLRQAEGIVGLVAVTGSSVNMGDVRSDPRYIDLFPDTRSECATPIKDRHGRVVAVLNVESDRQDAYSDEDRRLMTTLADLASMVLEREVAQTREMALIEIGTSMGAALTEEALIDRVISVAENTLRLEACSIFLIDRLTGTFVLRGTVGKLKNSIGKISYKKGEGITGWVCETGEPIILNDPQYDPRWRGKYTEFPSAEIASFLAVPIVSRSSCIGVIRVLRRKSSDSMLDVRFDPSDLSLLQAIAEQVAVGLENLRGLDRIIRSERMIAWGELSAKSSHMIGNRVFALKGDVNELGHLLEDPATSIESLREIQKSLKTNVGRVDEILQDFRDFLSATHVTREEADINQIVSETVQEVFPKRSKVVMRLELDPSLGKVRLDAKRFRRAISELIENSLTYIDSGEMSVRTSKVDRSATAITRNSKTASFAQIVVEDSGPGVDDEQKSIIFQPFYSGRAKGMGLGLSIVKGIVEAHGGYVFEGGEQGLGARFVILMPI